MFADREFSEFSYPTDLHYSQTPNLDKSLTMSLVTLQIHTTLKRRKHINRYRGGLVTLQIHTTLKPETVGQCTGLFSYPTDSHYSQTTIHCMVPEMMFSYPTDLHYSQTSIFKRRHNSKFSYPTDLHYSQTSAALSTMTVSLVTLQIYTTLKLFFRQYNFRKSLVTLQIYTTLKLTFRHSRKINCLVTLQIYTTLKPPCAFEVLRYCLVTLQIYTTLKLREGRIRNTTV